MIYEANSLYHHGVKGMKWGIRHDKETSGTKNKDDETSDENKKNKRKIAIKVGVGIAVTTLAIAGGVYLAKNAKAKELISHGENAINGLLSAKASSTETIKKLNKAETLSETLSKVNPNKENKDYKHNCTLCSVATFLRQQGLDVTASSTGGKGQNLGGVVEACFKNAKVLDGSAAKFGKSKQDAADMLLKRYGQNAEGVCGIQWKNNVVDSGHAFNWRIKDGIVSFFDGQRGLNDSQVSRYWNSIDPNGSLQLARLDGLEINVKSVKDMLE